MSKSGSKIREQVAHFLVDIHTEAFGNEFHDEMDVLDADQGIDGQMLLLGKGVQPPAVDAAVFRKDQRLGQDFFQGIRAVSCQLAAVGREEDKPDGALSDQLEIRIAEGIVDADDQVTVSQFQHFK